MKQKSGPDKAPAEQVLKNIRRQTRRQYSAEEKIRIVLEVVELPARSDRASIAHARPHPPPQSRSPRGTMQREICLFPIGRPSPF